MHKNSPKAIEPVATAKTTEVTPLIGLAFLLCPDAHTGEGTHLYAKVDHNHFERWGCKHLYSLYESKHP